MLDVPFRYRQYLHILPKIEFGIMDLMERRGVLLLMSKMTCLGRSNKLHRRELIIASLMLSLNVSVSGKENSLESSIDALQKKYSQVRDLKMDFIQNYRSPRRSPRTETGILYLRRPGMMRWEYKSPDEKLFVSDGKVIYFYLPEEHQVQKTPVKESRDQRVPFLFLLGKGNLKKDFSRIEWATDDRPFFEGNRVLYAYPKKNIDEFAKILMEFDPQALQLQRITIFDVDGSKSEFVFTNIRENLGLSAPIFTFRIPANVEVLGSDLEATQSH
jgi:outer membrane lipoprotein carrier protein